MLVGEPPRSLARFAPYRAGAPLRRNRSRYPRTRVALTECLQAEELDLVLVPLVAFDSTGTRLGMGGGFYDRSFAFPRGANEMGRRPHPLGLGYEFQAVAELVRQPWDVPLDAVVTERALYQFSNAEGQA